MNTRDGVAIFPLNTVLFPGGVLPLRIFETRYIDMVRECMHREAPFGVCMITKGNEVGTAASHEAVGCLARIVDFDTEEAGLLHLRTIGGQRFHIRARAIEKNGLVRADLELLDADPEVEVPDEHAPCAALIRRVVDDLVTREPDAAQRMIAEPYQYESAAWVGNRLCEFLPIPLKARQKLMELPDPVVRLQIVHRFLQQQQVL